MTELNYYFKPLNSRQKEAIELYKEKDLLFLLGAAGTGKSFLAVALALADICGGKSKRDNILITRPIVESGERLGSLPGTVDEKVAPFMTPIWDCLARMVVKKDMNAASKLFESAPLAYLRGRTFNDQVAILDEAQNCTVSQLKLFLTRIGTNSKVIVTGDPHQSDLHAASGLWDVVSKLRDIPEVGIVYFNNEDCVRHPIVVEILKRL